MSKEIMRDCYSKQARMHKALANEARLMIIDRLNSSEMSVGQITTEVGLDQSTISKHLAVLHSAGIVGNRRQGTNVFYCLHKHCIEDMVSDIKDILEHRHRRQ